MNNVSSQACCEHPPYSHSTWIKWGMKEKKPNALRVEFKVQSIRQALEIQDQGVRPAPEKLRPSHESRKMASKSLRFTARTTWIMPAVKLDMGICHIHILHKHNRINGEGIELGFAWWCSGPQIANSNSTVPDMALQPRSRSQSSYKTLAKKDPAPDRTEIGGKKNKTKKEKLTCWRKA